MEVSPLLSPSGQPVFVAGGRQAWKTAEHRGWVGSFEWTRRRRKVQQTLVIWPAHRVLSSHGSESEGMWAITLSCMTDFVGFDRNGKATGGPSKDLLREAYLALPMLGKDVNDRQAWLSLVDAVVHFAPDLVTMPAAPASVRRHLAGESMWELTATDKSTGRVLNEKEA